jgi:hypothetical protein
VVVAIQPVSRRPRRCRIRHSDQELALNPEPALNPELAMNRELALNPDPALNLDPALKLDPAPHQDLAPGPARRRTLDAIPNRRLR